MEKEKPIIKKWIVPQDGMWDHLISMEMEKPYMKELVKFIQQERATKEIYPEGKDVLNAFKLTPFGHVRVVIVGQDPYHTAGAAHGLSFSSMLDRTPPSLQNIFLELEREYPGQPYTNTFYTNNLIGWANQGVLLLNRVLTVERGKADSHAERGWEQFTETMIKHLSDRIDPIVFMLWGNKAKVLAEYIDPRHLVLQTSHPSPFSVKQGFEGCGHFLKANEFLKKHYAGKKIHWTDFEVTKQLHNRMPALAGIATT